MLFYSVANSFSGVASTSPVLFSVELPVSGVTAGV